jgi:RNA polymerase sigma-32 factor
MEKHMSAALPVLSADTSLVAYMEKVSKLPYLSAEEEYMLAKRFADYGDVNAAHKLVSSHLRLVVKIAGGFRGYGLPIMEIISEGNVGLMQAVKKFDPEKGFRLSTYAMWWIKAAMQEYVLRSWSLVKLGTTAAQKKLFFNLKRLKSRLKKVDTTRLSPDEIQSIANELDVSERDVVEMDERLSFSDQSLNAPVLGDEQGDEMINYLESDQKSQEVLVVEQSEAEYQRALLKRAMEDLNDRERDIIIKRRMQDSAATLEELSELYSISRERVRQIEVRAFEKLQAKIVELQKA